MNPKWTPMRWPSAWRDASALELLNGTCINCLLMEKGSLQGSIASQAKERGLQLGDSAFCPSGVNVVPGVWPGVKLSRSGDRNTATSGPTGVPWVDSNGWQVRLTAAMQPGSEIWVDAKPPEPGLTGDSYVKCVADTAAYGGRWIITLDGELAVDIAAHKDKALETWQRLTSAAQFFQGHAGWANCVPQAVAGIVSDFSCKNEFFSHELLNLLARTNEQYRVVPKTTVSPASFAALKAVIYVDQEPPSAGLREQILNFVRAGGTLITHSKWGTIPVTPAKGYPHPRFRVGALGKGSVAIATDELDDPFLLANDAVGLIGHRHDLVRFWNGGALGSYLAVTGDGQRALLQLLFYAMEMNGAASLARPEWASVRVAGRYRSAKLLTLDEPSAHPLRMQTEKDSVLLHLPPVANYAAIELER